MAMAKSKKDSDKPKQSPTNSDLSLDSNDSNIEIQSKPKRKKPDKVSRIHQNQLLDISTELDNDREIAKQINQAGRPKDTISNSVDRVAATYLNNCNSCFIKKNTEIDGHGPCCTAGGAPIHDELELIDNLPFEQKYNSLKESFMNLETEMLMVQILFITLGPYILYNGIKYDNRALTSISIVLILYAATNIFLFLQN